MGTVEMLIPIVVIVPQYRTMLRALGQYSHGIRKRLKSRFSHSLHAFSCLAPSIEGLLF
jgi:hypothetical protein